MEEARAARRPRYLRIRPDGGMNQEKEWSCNGCVDFQPICTGNTCCSHQFVNDLLHVSVKNWNLVCPFKEYRKSLKDKTFKKCLEISRKNKFGKSSGSR